MISTSTIPAMLQEARPRLGEIRFLLRRAGPPQRGVAVREPPEPPDHLAMALGIFQHRRHLRIVGDGPEQPHRQILVRQLLPNARTAGTGSSAAPWSARHPRPPPPSPAPSPAHARPRQRRDTTPRWMLRENWSSTITSASVPSGVAVQVSSAPSRAASTASANRSPDRRVERVVLAEPFGPEPAVLAREPERQHVFGRHRRLLLQAGEDPPLLRCPREEGRPRRQVAHGHEPIGAMASCFSRPVSRLRPGKIRIAATLKQKCPLQQPHRMDRLASRQVADLVAARRAIGDDDILRRRRAHRRQQPGLGHRARFACVSA